MILRQIGKVISIGLLVNATSFAQAKTSRPNMSSTAVAKSVADQKFQRDLESLLGAPIKTKHGELNLRQSKDASGRVRKQILSGRDFSEIQLDQNGDGTVDYWSVTQGKKSVVASEPNRGRFLRLVISEKLPHGVQELTYLLKLDGRSYALFKTRFMGNDFALADESLPLKDVFIPTNKLRADDESDRVRRILDTGGEPDAIPASAVPSVSDDRFSLVERDWQNQQKTVFGEELVCLSTDNGYGRLATLQREWWKVLKFEVDEKSDRLTEKLKASAMFADNCKKPENSKEFERISQSLSQVMLSSAKGDEWTSTTSRGRYLRCLEQSGLGIVAAQIERGFLDALNGSYQSFPPITCEINRGPAGLAKPAEAFPSLRQVAIYMSADQEGKAKERDGSTQNYANTIFHELIHIAGVSDEDTAHAAQACCGDPSETRGQACNKLDLLVAKAARAKTLETFLSRVSGDLFPLQAELAKAFGTEDANRIYSGFLEGLDSYKKGSPPLGTYPDGLLSSAQFSKCVETSSVDVCKAQWTNEIASYTEVFFAKKCKVYADYANRKNCTKMPQAFKDSLARTIVSSMIDPSAPGGGQCISKSVGIDSQARGDFFAVVVRVLTSVFGFEAHAAEDDDCPKFDVPSAPTTAPVVCANNECGPTGNTATNVDATKPPEKTWSVPGETRSGDASQTSDRPTNSSGSGGGNGGRLVTTSPLPVQRVDNVSDSRPFAEDHYRRATDLVGSATRQIEKVRDSILPRAEAGNGDRRADSPLGLKDSFVAFRPSEFKSVKTSIDNPFAEKRSIASISNLSSGAQKSVSATGAGDSKAANLGSAGNGTTVDKPSTGPNARASAAKTTRGGQIGTEAGLRSAASVNGGNGISKEKSKPDPLAGLFELPYSEIEPRLTRLDVSEALISAKISVQDAKGRKLGSNRAKERYIFAGFEQPLKRAKD